MESKPCWVRRESRKREKEKLVVVVFDLEGFGDKESWGGQGGLCDFGLGANLGALPIVMPKLWGILCG